MLPKNLFFGDEFLNILKRSQQHIHNLCKANFLYMISAILPIATHKYNYSYYISLSQTFISVKLRNGLQTIA